MPRKPIQKRERATIVVDGVPIAVTLHPPTGSRTSWYAYWSGLVTSKSTGEADLNDAVKVVEAMLRNGGRRLCVNDSVLSDESFLEIQRIHFGRKTDSAAKARADKSLEECEDAIIAFKEITGLAQIALATPDDCAKFQREALTKPRNWRRRYPNGRPTEERISPNTVLKWSRTLQSSFNRANRSAGKKCVRGVVEESKLMTSNPWTQFTWIEGKARPIRQFDADELRSFLEFLDKEWSGVPIAIPATKLFFWSCCRRLEIASLTWDALRLVESEVHFEVVGKWGVERWFRIPQQVFRDLLSSRTDSPYVFAPYSEQIRETHEANAGCLTKIRADFVPSNFGRWMYERIKEWSAKLPNGRAGIHVFRKTSLQYAHDGEDEKSEAVALDAGVSKSVLLKHYVKPNLWRKSNRTYCRLLASLPGEIARLYGHEGSEQDRLRRELEVAKEAGNWSKVAEIANALAMLSRPNCA